MSKISSNEFNSKSPSKIIDKASAYSKNIQKYHQLPHSTEKLKQVSQLAQYEKEYIEYVVNDAKEQLQLFRNKEMSDLQTRHLYEKKIMQAAVKVEKNQKEILKKKQKLADDYNKHVINVYKKYVDEEKRHRQSQKQQAYKLRKQLQEFYDKQEQRKKMVEHKQVQIGTQYQKAVERINKIHEMNELYSMKAETQLEKQLNKNNHYDEILSLKKRAVSTVNQNKPNIMNQSLSIFKDRQNNFIQRYGKNQAHSIQAWKHIDKDCQKTRKRLAEFFKKRVEKWSNQKKRVDAAKAQTPRKCLDILDKTSKSAFRKTVSTFRDSFLGWEQSVKKNKSVIKETDEAKKDMIMDIHLDLRFQNNSSFKIREKMNSMRQQAGKVANAYL